MAASKGPDHYRRWLTTVPHLGCRRRRAPSTYLKITPVAAGVIFED